MFLQRTPQAITELARGQRRLGLRERSLLLLAQSMLTQQLNALYHGQGAALVQQLVQAGFLEPPCATATPAAQPPNTSNLAGVRMHLFDLCERLFANRTPEIAGQLRQLLREARDIDSMLAVRDTLLQAIETHAGAERAAAIRQQLDSMLPEHCLAAD